MATTREWPAGIICISFWCLDDAYAVRRPPTYQDLITTAASLFRTMFDETAEELYIKTKDFGLEMPVEVFPDIWEMPEVQAFLRTVEFHIRTREEGSSRLDITSANRTQAKMPLSPGSTPPRDDPERALAHSTPAKRRAEAGELTDDGQMSVGDREYSEEEEIEQPQPESLRSVRTRVSLQARGTNNNPRPIRIIRAEPTNEEIAPSSSQEPDLVADTRIYVEVRHEDDSITVKARPQSSFASLLRTACNNFRVDKATVKLFQLVSFDGRDSMSPIECNLTLTMAEGNVTNDDVFILLSYGSDD
ncbi:hypothetical protein BJ322DRAFT_1067937 [Thelephora terrestris]|uniref:Uncharacterized protein n=1 Tax=Thelephora terrestris TaxID=56493 RepID=A0A9P6HCU8_9AGAM|nr:hypothetical protein BJ322DRAFT_1067937 [Thelephora terrestris]